MKQSGRAMRELARPNEFKDSAMLERWVSWCYPEVWAKWKLGEGIGQTYFWHWIAQEYPDMLTIFKQLTWEG